MILYAKKSGLYLDNEEIPGIFQELSIDGEYVVDSGTNVGDGGNYMSITGTKNRSISITLQLLPTPKNETNFLTEIISINEQIASLEKIFNKQSIDTPTPIQIKHEHIQARGINWIMFTGFSSSENNLTNIVIVTLQFEEYIVLPENDSIAQKYNIGV